MGRKIIHVFPILALLSLSTGLIDSLHCPTRCRCSRTHKIVCNGLQRIPQELDISTKILILKANEIIEIRSERFRKLNKLRVLDISENGVMVLKDVFTGTRNLRQLYLQKNRIEIIMEYVFGNLYRLRKLDLSSNKLRTLHSNCFQQLTNLVVLKLQGNRLTNVHISQFQSNVDLQLLWLHRNDFTMLDERVLLNNRKLRRLRIYNEFMKCNCLQVARKACEILKRLELITCARPILTRQPKSREMEKGEEFMMYCVPKNAYISITWIKDGVNLASESEGIEAGGLIYSGEFSSPISVSCSVKGEAGETISKTARLQLKNERVSGFIKQSVDASSDSTANYNVTRVQRFSENKRPEAELTTGQRRKIEGVVKQATDEVNRSIKRTEDARKYVKVKSGSEILKLTRFARVRTDTITEASDIFGRAIELIQNMVKEKVFFDFHDQGTSVETGLPRSIVQVVHDLAGCALQNRRRLTCSQSLCANRKYRTIDGTCNNMERGLEGSARTAMERLLPPLYENGLNSPRGWDRSKLHNGYKLPGSRAVSKKLISAAVVSSDNNYSGMLMQWGQFLDHDMTLTPQAASGAQFFDGRFCNETCVNESPCFPIPAIPEDRASRTSGMRCFGVTRSAGVCGSGLTSMFFERVTYREQINEITAYIDGSMIYGSHKDIAIRIRDPTFRRGLLLVNSNPLRVSDGKGGLLRRDLLPPSLGGDQVDCQANEALLHVPCYLAGDIRANEQLGLLAMHTVWMREHNRISTSLAIINSHWTDEQLYQETRKIIGAMIQHITFKSWLPRILGRTAIAKLGVYTGYKPDEKATIVNEFATAAFRFGHTMISETLHRLDSNFNDNGYFLLKNTFYTLYG